MPRSRRCIIYTVRRTQLYLDEGMLKLLKIRARQHGCTVSDLVREALREKYLPDAESRRRALESMVGLWKDRTDLPDTEEYVRELRRGNRIERLLG